MHANANKPPLLHSVFVEKVQPSNGLLWFAHDGRYRHLLLLLLRLLRLLSPLFLLFIRLVLFL